MKRTVLPALILLFLSPPLAAAGLTYDFATAGKGSAAGSMSGTASVEAGKARVEFTRGDGVLFQNGAVAITSDGGKTLRILDPKARTFYSLSFDDLFATAGALMKSMGSMFQLSFANQKVEVKPAGPGETIEGYPTKKYTILTSYDMTAKVLGSDLSSRVEMKTEVWATPRLSADYATFVQSRGLRTGIEGIDALIAAQSTGVEGFPLRQVTPLRTTQRARVDEQTTTVTISRIREGEIPASAFVVPAGFTEKPSPLQQLQKGKANG
ncbi:MAG TPA: DUF4412 domain-containing protein [Thermoanaerobaculia bacterium]